MQATFGQRFWRGLYSLAARVALPFSMFYLVWRGMRLRSYLDRWSERFALYRESGPDACLWLHAVSVGEVNAAAPLLSALRRRHPGSIFLVTTTTPTGSARARALWGDDVLHAYLPYDLPGAVRHFLDHFHPRLAVVMETEIWPNLYAELGRREIPLAIVNARLSQKSLRGYRAIRPLLSAALAEVNCVAAQSADDAERYRQLGARAQALTVTGNLKYDFEPPESLLPQAAQWRLHWRARPVWIAASTHPEEEAIVLAVHQELRKQFPNALLLWAPRHPERFEVVANEAGRAGFTVARRSSDGLPSVSTSVFVIDTLGELLAFYAAADVAFVGGSLQPIGGHNLLEPAALGVPALVGPHTGNFSEITELLLKSGAVRRVHDAASLVAAISAWWQDSAQAARCGAAGRDRIASERGALARTLGLLDRLCPPEPPVS
jgi:3-deoxy-D-manno-octulosonic-acid transferase